MQSTDRNRSRLLNSVMVVVYLGVGIAVPLLFIIGNHNKLDCQANGVQLTAAMQNGRQLFGDHCAVCHTLAATHAVGKIGPNLDVLRPSEATVVNTIAHGCVQQPTSSVNSCLGYGTMPADLVQGQDARDIAEFVAHVAGHT